METPSRREELQLLGKSEARFPDSPSREILETFANRHPHREYWVTFESPEFTSLCPVTGQPDFARLEIRYVPGERCVESKSLKFYLASYRSTPSFGEDVVNRILDDLVAVLQPRHLMVEAEFSPRGGISLSVNAEYPDTLPGSH